jgi:hypothetical protein
MLYAAEARWLYDVSIRRALLPRPGERRHLLKPPEVDPALPNFFTPRDVEWIG